MSRRQPLSIAIAIAIAIVIVTLSVSCISVQQPTPVPTVVSSVPRSTSENLDATLWMQAAAEYRALAIQAFSLGRRQIDAALADPVWSAIPGASVDGKPAAVIADIDETILDNSYYQARLIRDGSQYDDSTWTSWVDEARGTAIPGALEFARYAASHGVTMFYVTNRKAGIEEAATRRNLEALGFPIETSSDTVLTRHDRPEWESSDKEGRRQWVAERYRVLLMFGDDLGDFLPGVGGSVEARAAMIESSRELWGTRWIVLPNPTYGSWMQSVLQNRRGLSRDDALDMKIDALDPRR